MGWEILYKKENYTSKKEKKVPIAASLRLPTSMETDHQNLREHEI